MSFMKGHDLVSDKQVKMRKKMERLLYVKRKQTTSHGNWNHFGARASRERDVHDCATGPDGIVTNVNCSQNEQREGGLAKGQILVSRRGNDGASI